jgi:hypothetical protein
VVLVRVEISDREPRVLPCGSDQAACSLNLQRMLPAAHLDRGGQMRHAVAWLLLLGLLLGPDTAPPPTETMRQTVDARPPAPDAVPTCQVRMSVTPPDPVAPVTLEATAVPQRRQRLHQLDLVGERPGGAGDGQAAGLSAACASSFMAHGRPAPTWSAAPPPTAGASLSR